MPFPRAAVKAYARAGLTSVVDSRLPTGICVTLNIHTFEAEIASPERLFQRIPTDRLGRRRPFSTQSSHLKIDIDGSSA